VAYLAAQRWTIFHRQPKSRLDSPAHAGEFFVDVLQTIKVGALTDNIRQVTRIPEDMLFSEFKKMFAETKQHYFPVMDSQQKLVSIFSINDIRGVLFTTEIEPLVVMKDIGTSDIIVTTPSEDLNAVMKKFTIKNIDSLPVVKEDDHRELIGMLSRREVIAFYNEQLAKRKAETADGDGEDSEVIAEESGSTSTE
jgi:CIC family chloride channel protein